LVFGPVRADRDVKCDRSEENVSVRELGVRFLEEL
jgi:hypothetical protein